MRTDDPSAAVRGSEFSAELGAWQPMETAPASGIILLAVEDATGERRTFAAEASHDGTGALVWQITTGWIGWQRLHGAWRAVLWRRLPQAPNVLVTGLPKASPVD